jgi:hypothetical protein
MTDEVLYFSIYSIYSTRRSQKPGHPLTIYLTYLSLWTEDLQSRFGIVTKYLQAFVRSCTCIATGTYCLNGLIIASRY